MIRVRFINRLYISMEEWYRKRRAVSFFKKSSAADVDNIKPSKSLEVGGLNESG